MDDWTSNSFCGSRFWDTNLTWNTESPRFTPCLEKTIFWIPCIFLWIFSFIDLFYSYNSKSRNIPWNWRNILKLVLLSFLLALTVFENCYILFIKEPVYPVDIYTFVVKTLSLILCFALVIFHRKHGQRTSSLLFLFWFLVVFLGFFQFYISIQENISSIDIMGISNIASYCLYVLMFLLYFISDLPPKESGYITVKNSNPEDAASYPSRLLLFWFDRLVYKGFRRPLVQSDLWPMKYKDAAAQIFNKFNRFWLPEQKNKGSNDNSLKFSKNINGIDYFEVHKESKPKKQASIFFALCKAFGGPYIFATFMHFIEVLLGFASPEILKHIIKFVLSDEPMWHGYFYAVLMLLMRILIPILRGYHNLAISIIGLRTRTALISTIYRKSLRLSSAARKETTLGEIVNLMAVDSQSIMGAMNYINYLLFSPLEIGLAMYFLWQQLGPSVLASSAVMLLTIPINSYIARKTKQLQQEKMKNKDERVKMINEVLSGIKVLKLYAWEPSFIDRVLKIRDKEIKLLKKNAYLRAATSFLWSCVPFLVKILTFAAFVLLDENNILDSSKVFVSVSLFNLMITPLMMFPAMLPSAIQAAVSIKRINKFLNCEDLDLNTVTHDTKDEEPIVMEKCTFSWGGDEEPTLYNLNLKIKQGSLVALVGAVGSGKSSLISALLGEMHKESGRVNTRGTIAYVPQIAWIQNCTLQDNILFGKNLDSKKYHKVITACALKQDIEMLPGGDQTEIGEKGINVSGGQKQRISLARAVYADSDLYFLDDPLSAVDSHVGKHIFENVIGPNGLLSKKTRLLVTHSINFLPETDMIVVLKNGSISEVGTFRELVEKKAAFSEFLVSHLTEIDNEELEELDDNIKEVINMDLDFNRQISNQRSINNSLSSLSSLRKRSLSQHSGKSIIEKSIGTKLIEEEKAGVGRIQWRVYADYFQAIGTFLVTICFALIVINQAIEVGSYILLSKWSDDKETVINGTQNKEKRNMYLELYGLLGVAENASKGEDIIAGCAVIQENETFLYKLYSAKGEDTAIREVLRRCRIAKQQKSVVVTDSMSVLLAMMNRKPKYLVVTNFFSSLTWYVGAVNACGLLHSLLLKKIMHSRMSFFDTSPQGRILNRFSKDLDVLENSIPYSFRQSVLSLATLLGTIFVISYSVPAFLIVIIPIGLVYYWIQKFYITTSQQLKRIESVTISPVYSHFGESVSGSSVIRAYGAQKRFIEESDLKVDLNQSCSYATIVAEKWLGIRVELIGGLICFFASLFAIIGKDYLSPGIVGLSISYTLEITIFLHLLVLMVAEVESNIVALERIKEYSNTPQEAAWNPTKNIITADWPLEGKLEFVDYSVRYRDGLDLVLEGINLSIKGGEKIGIVGRTGAGKSSVTLSLFRIIEAAGGKILIDGVDISTVGLHELRSRLTIIPQEPILFSGSLRMNLDPFGRYSDEQVWRALELSHLKAFVQELPAGLQHEVSEGGENLSVGQRQLICLARALLRKTKILILDEATAAVDLETDDFIQRTIRSMFADCTILTIAHRLNTIMDSDRILVLDRGKVVEFDSPKILLKNRSSLFYSLALDAGLA